MFVTENMIADMAARYGQPERAGFRYELPADQFGRIRASQKHGRNHDVTVYIRKGDDFVVIAKHMYPPELFRAPSGGLRPGEPFLDGVNREITEETGCTVELERFLLRTAVSFVRGEDGSSSGNAVIEWRSLVFLARYISGDFRFTDHQEIREVRLATLDEFENFSRIMRATDIGGLHYRAALHDTVKRLLPTVDAS